MQSLAEFMAESFNSNVPLTWDLSGVSRAIVSFTVDSVKATVAFERPGSGGPWHVTFEVAKGLAAQVADYARKHHLPLRCGRARTWPSINSLDADFGTGNAGGVGAVPTGT